LSRISTGSVEAAARTRRAFWLKHLHQWHWISSAICLVVMLGFAITGFTLNHAGDIEARPTVQKFDAQLPAAVLESVAAARAAAHERRDKPGALPEPLIDWLASQWHIDAGQADAEWSDDELDLTLARPGGDSTIAIDLGSGEVHHERTDRGLIAYLNDLHKGRHTGAAWNGFIDVFALACLVFCLTGLVLLQLHAGNRGATWPMVGLGVVIPLVLVILFIH
jgi:hypothetical protein